MLVCGVLGGNQKWCPSRQRRRGTYTCPGYCKDEDKKIHVTARSRIITAWQFRLLHKRFCCHLLLLTGSLRLTRKGIHRYPPLFKLCICRACICFDRVEVVCVDMSRNLSLSIAVCLAVGLLQLFGCTIPKAYGKIRACNQFCDSQRSHCWYVTRVKAKVAR